MQRHQTFDSSQRTGTLMVVPLLAF